MSDMRLYDAGVGCLNWIILAIVISALAGCTSAPAAAPEPIIRTVEVQVPVPQPCDAATRIGEAPAYPDSDQALGAASGIFKQVQLLLAGRALRRDRLATIEGALRACR